jgi:type IV secretory pathway VirB4 component
MLKKSNKQSSSRRQIAIEGVRDGILLLPKNKYRAVLQVSSINFELKSEAEQDALIDTYQSVLNSLAIPLQIVVRVRELDMDKYLENFQARLSEESEAIYRQQTTNYVEFVQRLVTKNKILTRSFYVVLPHDTHEKDFDVIKEQLALHVDIVAKGLARLGMHARRLDSLELLDLFYSFYSPTGAKRQPLRQQTMQLMTEAVL